jgi:hypothetical protein
MKRIATLVGLSVRAHLQGVTVTVTVGPGDDLAAVAANIAIAVSKGATHAHRAGVWGPKH